MKFVGLSNASACGNCGDFSLRVIQGLGMEIQMECQSDESSVDALVAHAFAASEFGHHGEAELVKRLRLRNDVVSLVARSAGQVVGQILFSPVQIPTKQGDRKSGMALAPMCVRPDRQRQGIGSQLVQRGLDILSNQNCPFVVVLGHPGYYPRFNFELASNHGIGHGFAGIPDDVFFIRALSANAAADVSGTCEWCAEFSDLA